MATTMKKKAPAKATKPKLLHVGVVWDMSGSMGSCTEGSREGIRSYLADLIEQENELRGEHGDGIYTKVSLTAFDTIFEPWLRNVPVADVDTKICDDYQPRGGTALYDAIASTITEMSPGVKSGEKALVVIMTDGGENSSVEYNLLRDGRKRLFDLVKAMEAKGNWTFVYLGANVDVYAEAAAIGVPAGNAAFYANTRSSHAHTSSALKAMSHSHRISPNSSDVQVFATAGIGTDYRDPGATSGAAAPVGSVTPSPVPSHSQSLGTPSSHSHSLGIPSSALEDAKKARRRKKGAE